MKTLTLLLLALLMAAPAQALPRRQHLLRGTIVGVDPAARMFTVDSPTVGVVVLVWDDTTKLRDGKSAIPPAALAAGQTVKLYYRADVGAKVARDVTIVSEKSLPP